MNKSIQEKKQKTNERKEDAPGSIDLQVIERKWEPRCAFCVRVHIMCTFVVKLQTYIARQYYTPFWWHISWLLISCLLFGIDSV